MKFLLIALFAVSVVFATELTATGGVAGGTQASGTDAETVFWSQLPTGYALGSQYFLDYYPTYDAGVAEDFTFTASTTINKIRFWGAYWNGTPPAAGSLDLEIYLYNDNGTGNAPTLPEHTTAIQSWTPHPGEYTEVVDGANRKFEYAFPTWVTFNPNIKYWFECRNRMSFAANGQFGWVQSNINGVPCVQGFTGLGVAWWTPQAGYGAAFELIFDDALALDRATWAEVKTLF